jgi:hypothetical protein
LSGGGTCGGGTTDGRHGRMGRAEVEVMDIPIEVGERSEGRRTRSVGGVEREEMLMGLLHESG